MIVETLDPPFAHAGKVGMPKREGYAYQWLPCQIGKAAFSAGEEAFGNVQARVFREIDKLFNEIPPGRFTLCDDQH